MPENSKAAGSSEDREEPGLSGRQWHRAVRCASQHPAHLTHDDRTSVQADLEMEAPCTWLHRVLRELDPVERPHRGFRLGYDRSIRRQEETPLDLVRFDALEGDSDAAPRGCVGLVLVEPLD